MRSPSREQAVVVVAGLVGLAFALPAESGLATALHLFGYPVAMMVIVRFTAVVRERRTAWFAVHEAAMASICLGFVVMDQTGPIVPNAGWLVIAAIWYVAGKRRERSP